MTRDQAIAHFGSQAAIAQLLGLSKQAVSGWPEPMPGEAQMRLHKASKGKVRADTAVIRYYRELTEGVL